ncbi:MAG TPA: N-acetylglucosamine-specific PTS transporter subunit IIBC [Caulobacteraceae bacterium]|jgi:PTS system N-acetylglucosamine-specific IIC component|nr:N-acetylglucosamine-specific PTS transporter subunit IIBC [Caulobacteraceae bacterium]
MKVFGRTISAGALQPLGRALMLPIAVLPVAGLILRIGQPDLANVAFIAAAGNAIFHNLGLLFAIGVAVGFARDGNGAAGLAGVVCFLVASAGAEALITPAPAVVAGLSAKLADLATADFRAQALFKLSVPLGILSGLIAGGLYNRFGAIKLPDYLAFFGGRRFVPIVSGLAGLALAAVFGFGWSGLDVAIDSLSRFIVGAGPIGLFLYGALNRLLIVTGLHHILNNIAWFIIGDFHGATGDLNRFFAGDPTAGAFMAGFFPVMMFGLPAACLAMFHEARPERRAETGGLLLSLALTSFLTGVTEPIEFSFMFLAPVLYLLHALFTGTAMVIMNALGVRLGFGFSAGLFDYLLNYGKATRPLLLLPVGAAYFALYYGVFRAFIRRFDLKTPGREAEAPARGAAIGSRAEAFILALGGAANLGAVGACATRLRLTIADQSAVDEARLKALGAHGVVRPSEHDLQVIVGGAADQIAREISEAVAAGPPPSASTEALASALGGLGNLAGLVRRSSRVIVDLADPSLVDTAAARAAGARDLVISPAGKLHIILGPEAERVAQALQPVG